MFDSGLRVAKVVKVYPDGHSVDLVMYDDDSPQTNVQVLSPMATRRSGSAGLVVPTPPPDGEWGNQDSHEEDIYAVVGYMRGSPIVIGFLYPQVNQMTFPDKNRFVHRFPSDVYLNTDKNGNTELFHPSGTYVRIGESFDHENLTAKDYDKKWKIDRNKSKSVHFHITVANEANGPVFSFNVTPAGKVQIWAKNDICIESETHIVLNAPRIDENPSWGKGTGGPLAGGVPE